MRDKDGEAIDFILNVKGAKAAVQGAIKIKSRDLIGI
jgi:hypothetical protein